MDLVSNRPLIIDLSVTSFMECHLNTQIKAQTELKRFIVDLSSTGSHRPFL